MTKSWKILTMVAAVSIVFGCSPEKKEDVSKNVQPATQEQVVVDTSKEQVPDVTPEANAAEVTSNEVVATEATEEPVVNDGAALIVEEKKSEEVVQNETVAAQPEEQTATTAAAVDAPVNTVSEEKETTALQHE